MTTKLADYLVNTKPAIEVALDFIFEKQKMLEGLRTRLDRIYADISEINQLQRLASDKREHWVVTEEMRNRLRELRDEKVEIQELYSPIQDVEIDKLFSLGCIAGSVFQIAKQGLSKVYGETKNWPEGRRIGSLTMGEIILSTRNQAMHYEVGTSRPEVERVFNTLSRECHTRFSLYKKVNLAHEVLCLVGWRSHDLYMSDMLLFS